ncbi:TFIIB-type zinc ribbon-containing protein [Enterococcus sp. LJL90]
MDVLTYKCPNCGGPLTFNPEDQKFHCDYCLSIFTEEQVSAVASQQAAAQMGSDTATQTIDATDSEPTAATLTETEPVEEAQLDLFLCPSCGAEIVTDTTTAATYCYYCHNPVVLSERLSGKFLPDKVLPFAVEKEEAVEKFIAWTKKKWFVPKNFFNKAQIEKLTGVYFPYWVIDANLKGSLSATGTAIRVWRVGDIEYTETKIYQVQRKGKLAFFDLVKNALSKNTQQKMVHMVQPFPLEKAVKFKSQYLSGFQAEKRDIEMQALQEEVRGNLKDYSEDLLRDTVAGYATVTNVNTNIAIENENNRYLLLPVWLVTYRSNGDGKKVYFYAMNGQTGKVSGILPISSGRLALASLGIFAVVLLIALIGGYFI